MRTRNMIPMWILTWICGFRTLLSAQEGVLPPSDPSPDRTLTTLNHKNLSQHPRLLFGPEDLRAIRAHSRSSMGQVFMRNLEKYLIAPPSGPEFANNDTDGQRHGLWRMPSLAMHYLLTGNQTSFDRAKAYLSLVTETGDWQRGGERNSGMGAANVMIGAALVYDWLYNDLDPAFRERVRQKLILQSRWMYYGGHQNKNRIKNAYWQGDPHNNHRWHRNAGLSLCVIAAYTGSPQETWLLETVKKELDYVMEWKAKDGSYSEGPGYMIFGGLHLMLALNASDRNLGTDFLSSPFIRNNGKFLAQSLVPDRSAFFVFNDMSEGEGLAGYANYLYKIADLTGDRHLQFLLNDTWRNNPKSSVHVSWVPLMWHNPDVPETGLENFATDAVFPSSGVAYIRDGWTEDHVGATFRCAAVGGTALNAFRNANNFKYVNVAHDDPDANSFILWKNGGYLAETSRYSHAKQSSNHNTILINGQGQAPKGRSPGPTKYLQPGGGGFNMLDMAWFTAWRPGKEVTFVEGEAAGAYGELNSRGMNRPALSRYRRTFVWVEGKYVLVIDDIRSDSGSVDLTWLMQAKNLTQKDAAAGRYVLSHPGAAAEMQVVAEPALQPEVTRSSADHRGSNLGWRQLRLSGKSDRFQIASLYDLWGGGSISLAMKNMGPDQYAFEVISGNTRDIWFWKGAENAKSASALIGQRNGLTFAELDPKHAFQ